MQYYTIRTIEKKYSGQKLNKNIFSTKKKHGKKTLLSFSFATQHKKKTSKNAAMLYIYYLQNIFHIFFLFESLGIYTQNTLYTSTLQLAFHMLPYKQKKNRRR